MNDSMTFAVIVFTAVVAFIVAKLVPQIREQEKKCPPCPPPPKPDPWRFLGGSIWIRRRQEIEENYHGIMPPEGK